MAGKDTATEYMVQKFGAEHFRFTHILDAILEELNLPVSRKNEIDLGLGLRKIFGEHVLVNALERRLKKAWAKLNVVNGIRMDEMDVIKSWPNNKMVYITAPVEIRFARYQTRREKTDDAQMNFEEFVAQEKGPTEIRIPELGQQADYRIDNVGSLEEFYVQIDALMNELKISKV